MDMQHVRSKAIKAIGYEDQTSRLFIKFRLNHAYFPKMSAFYRADKENPSFLCH